MRTRRLPSSIPGIVIREGRRYRDVVVFDEVGRYAKIKTVVWIEGSKRAWKGRPRRCCSPAIFTLFPRTSWLGGGRRHIARGFTGANLLSALNPDVDRDAHRRYCRSEPTNRCINERSQCDRQGPSGDGDQQQLRDRKQTGIGNGGDLIDGRNTHYRDDPRNAAQCPTRTGKGSQRIVSAPIQ